ncbi:hypothetical protein RFI_13957, partial [Reticulomyxa filosa]
TTTTSVPTATTHVASAAVSSPHKKNPPSTTATLLPSKAKLAPTAAASGITTTTTTTTATAKMNAPKSQLLNKQRHSVPNIMNIIDKPPANVGGASKASKDVPAKSHTAATAAMRPTPSVDPKKKDAKEKKTLPAAAAAAAGKVDMPSKPVQGLILLFHAYWIFK